MSSGFFFMMILLALVFFAMRGHRMLGGGGAPQQLAATGYPAPGLEPRMTDAARASLDADITRFGDELRELDLDVVGYDLDKEAQARYAEALDAYENAKQAMNMAQLASDATAVAHILEEGRYAMACVRSGARGEPMPERRPPCFFDPSHGPSTRNVMWTPDGGTAREVPACALDAARVTSGAAPHIRMVQQGYQAVPYWQDQGHAAYARGYYEPYMGGGQMVDGMVKGALLFGGLSLFMGLLDD
ncbi:hypothetical protein EII34_06115 [Arachnia propionica]|uniref:Uncharacterized protein n=1 Tax=Arachnia propionica TaxID=1750 RepID=A0A3P1T8X0_9ACTN|nr:hypothetical protein [Arachnia propionica]MDO5082228.1 hypothetical protein [Arachnia propionica]RRD05780.1 hypothetical protein EII34_06115 [Arachnia propionica]